MPSNKFMYYLNFFIYTMFPIKKDDSLIEKSWRIPVLP